MAEHKLHSEDVAGATAALVTHGRHMAPLLPVHIVRQVQTRAEACSMFIAESRLAALDEHCAHGDHKMALVEEHIHAARCSFGFTVSKS